MSALQKKYKKAVVLGAAGFIGINLVKSLVAQGFDTVCFDQTLSNEWPDTAKAIIGDFSSMPNELLETLDDAYVFHLVSSSRPSSTTVHAANEINIDVVSTIKYLESTKDRELKWIFISSGGTIYGQQDIASISETCIAEPICSYGLVKLTIENYFALYRKLHQLDYTIIRLANPYGPWQDPHRGQGIVAALIYKAQTGRTVEIWGDGSNVRDYVYISDAIAGIIIAATDAASGEIYNLGSGIGTSIVELINVIANTLKVEMSVENTAFRSVDVRRNVLSSNKLSQITGWNTSVDLQSGLALTSAWIKKNFE
jgi:UDP-glucose 4-epimerase